ncbi:MULTISPECIES: hypothetical protein [Methylomonas]|uniref:Uncharacterized protein n=1 Tax=Methylomonas koyamae TaxID=702114 RepID=A0A291IIG2_9GAMM|nr:MULTISPECIES: hypothetical protein [Methylomonas]ANE55166.1 hypothetical protein AYM39_08230 [Methylomonas sp. DH-1]ATG89960.1 hypothetical protein MKLM6_1721 [Methylomonas koyamae]OAI25892.1 hypothetical protein A1356_12610 [Methylomonas koyamae]WNB74315.1 hypothetical protein RI210_13620 [Methylomonas koyamae]BBL59122.1 hypothetical protein MKFW12EY_27350 [Methylomonas koyamae]
MIKTTFIGSLFATLLLANPVHATEYIYRDIMANTLAPEHCQAESKAKENAAKNYNIDRFSKKFCQSQGYGWHVDEVKSVGNTVCDSCGTTQEARCHQEDVVVSCKRIKPGTVGMLPGKG